MAYYSEPVDPTRLQSWHALQTHHDEMRNFSMRGAFAEDSQRFDTFSLNSCGLFLDYSKNLITFNTQDLLIRLAYEVGLEDAKEALFSGETVNTSEQRSALHTALRRPLSEKVVVNGVDIMGQVHTVLNRMTELVSRVHGGIWRGYTERSITDVVNIGIGGSFLGPQLVCEALTPFAQRGVKCHFLSNIDGSEFQELVRKLSAETTLFIVSSKSFTTLEALKNAQAARDWCLAHGCPENQLFSHFAAVSSNPEAAMAFGIAKENIFPMWDWVGGRYSLWSAIGLPIALTIGVSNFKDLLAGAYAMDRHFLTAPLEKNMPVIMGLLGVWYNNFWGTASHAILPYDYYLRNFDKHLQQLDMESNGKQVRHDGQGVSIQTGPVIWGGVGCNGQHAYHQLLHQGTHLIPADFIAAVVSHNPLSDHQQWLFANCVAQSQALMQGMSRAEVEEDLQSMGLSKEEVERITPHKVIPGNRPSNMIMMERVTPFTLGALIALYEHKVFVQSVIWGVNCFDQWGVELGKALGQNVYRYLVGAAVGEAGDSSTQGQINFFKAHHRG
ncbi:glucose-6-phosphate isomerase [Pseudomonas sp. BGM005]|nr:glucose-6-phosphate isomerase [Pseudomonas sp. BG5]